MLVLFFIIPGSSPIFKQTFLAMWVPNRKTYGLLGHNTQTLILSKPKRTVYVTLNIKSGYPRPKQYVAGTHLYTWVKERQSGTRFLVHCRVTTRLEPTSRSQL